MNVDNVTSGKAPFPIPDLVRGSMPASAVSAFMAAVGDIALILSADGTVVDISVSNGELTGQGFANWVGSAWIDTVTIESRPKITEMLSEVANPAVGNAPRWRQVNHITPDGDVPVRYMVLALGDHGQMIAIGRDLRSAAMMQQRLLKAQQALERDYIRLRQSETRYRVLFDMVAEPVLVVDAEDRRIREANPAAHRVLDASLGDLVGRSLTEIVASEHRGQSDRASWRGRSGRRLRTNQLAPRQHAQRMQSFCAAVTPIWQSAFYHTHRDRCRKRRCDQFSASVRRNAA